MWMLVVKVLFWLAVMFFLIWAYRNYLKPSLTVFKESKQFNEVLKNNYYVKTPEDIPND